MTDLLVRLYALPPTRVDPWGDSTDERGVLVRRAQAYDKHAVRDFAGEFNAGWASEVDVAMSHHPLGAFVAITERRIVGFACYDATFKGYFGPLGVAESFRGQGIGAALLLAGLWALRHEGYAYGIIGGGGDARDFYEKTAGATVISDSDPGAYR